MWQSLFETVFPKADISVWLEPFEENRVGYTILAVVVLLLLGIAMLITANGRFPLILLGVVLLLLAAAVLAITINSLRPTPLRIDFAGDQINFLHVLGNKRFDLNDLIEVRQEKITQKFIQGEESITKSFYQLAWVFNKLGTITIQQPKQLAAWQVLLDQLEANEWVTFFQNKTRTPIKFDMFGDGSTRPMDLYLVDKTAVNPTSLDELLAWLKTCTYERDIDQFKSEDYWLLPSEFETRKVGDCEDHALWTWQKLKQLGIPAEFVTGVVLTPKQTWGGHAWIMFRQEGKLFVLETVNKKNKMIKPWEEAKKVYKPGLSIDHELNTYHYRELNEDSS